VDAEDDVPSNLGRNEPCPCGSGKKYKQCHLAADEAKEREARAKASAEAPAPAAAGTEDAAPAPGARPKHVTRQPWKKTATNTQGFGKTSLPRKVGGS
jgi:SEC-C motif